MDEEIKEENLDENQTYSLIGEEITYYNKTFDVKDFTNKKKIKKNIEDFIEDKYFLNYNYKLKIN